MEKATAAIVGVRFGLSALSEEECDQLTWLLTIRARPPATLVAAASTAFIRRVSHADRAARVLRRRDPQPDGATFRRRSRRLPGAILRERSEQIKHARAAH